MNPGHLLLSSISVFVAGCGMTKHEQGSAMLVRDVQFVGRDPAFEEAARELGWKVVFKEGATILSPGKTATFDQSVLLMRLAQKKGARSGTVSEPLGKH